MGRDWKRAVALMLASAIVVPAAVMASVPVAAQDAAPGCTAGSSGIGDGYYPLAGNGGYDVLHYALDLDLNVDAAAVTSGKATIQALATTNLCAFNLDFRGPGIDRVSVDGRPAAFGRRAQELTVLAPTPIGRGAAFVVAVEYHGSLETIPIGAQAVTPVAEQAAATPVSVDADLESREPEVDLGVAGGEAQTVGGLFHGAGSLFLAGEPFGAEALFPVNGHPADKATYAFRLTVPDPYLAVANGILTERIAGDSTTTTVWETRDPMASYVATLHAAEIDLEETTTDGGLPVFYAFAKGIPEAERAVVRRTPEMVAFLETVYGPYPFASMGGTIVGAPFGIALETQGLPIYGSPAALGSGEPESKLLEDLENIVAHELAHQWVADSVSPLRWRDIWLSEGFGTYGEFLWVGHSRGPAAFDARLAEAYEIVVERTQFQHAETRAGLSAAEVLARFDISLADVDAQFLDAIGVASPEELERLSGNEVLDRLAEVGFPIDDLITPPVLTGDPGPAENFSYPFVYLRGALTVHALRLELGDETFFALLRGWTHRFHHGNATVEDFIAFAEEFSGQELDAFFAAWLFSPELPPLDLGAAATPVP